MGYIGDVSHLLTFYQLPGTSWLKSERNIGDPVFFFGGWGGCTQNPPAFLGWDFSGVVFSGFSKGEMMTVKHP